MPPNAPPPPHAPGSIRVDIEEGGLVLHLSGEIDSATVDAFQASEAADPGSSRVRLVLVVDASAVTFMNSVGVGFLLRRTEATRDAGLRPLLRRPSRSALQVLRLTGTEALFDRID
jgi:anti-anti-sigma factor